MYPVVKLLVRHPERGAFEVTLDPRKAYKIGRQEADVTLDQEPRCSRHHATLEFNGSIWQLKDENSSNGTLVAGNSIRTADLHPGVVARIGETSLELIVTMPGGMPMPGFGAFPPQGMPPQGMHPQGMPQGMPPMGYPGAPAGMQHPGMPAQGMPPHMGAQGPGAQPQGAPQMPAQNGQAAAASSAPQQSDSASDGEDEDEPHMPRKRKRFVANAPKRAPLPSGAQPGRTASGKPSAAADGSAAAKAREAQAASEAAKESNAPLIVGVVGFILLVLVTAAYTFGNQFVSAPEDQGSTVAKTDTNTPSATLEKLRADLAKLEGTRDPEERITKIEDFAFDRASAYAGTDFEQDLNRARERAKSALHDDVQDTVNIYNMAKDRALRNHFSAADDLAQEFLAACEPHGKDWRAISARYEEEAKALRTQLAADSATFEAEQIQNASDLRDEANSLIETERAKEGALLLRDSAACLQDVLDLCIISVSTRISLEGQVDTLEVSAREALQRAGAEAVLVRVDASELEKRVAPAKDLGLSEANSLLPQGQDAEDKLIAAVFERIQHDVKEGKVRAGVEIDGRRRTITHANDRGVYVYDAEAEFLITWDRLTFVQIFSIAQSLENLTQQEMLGLALLGFNQGYMVESTRVMVQIYEADPRPAIKRDLDDLLASKTRQRVPDGGFVIFEGLFVRPENRAAIINEREIRAIIERFEKGVGSREGTRKREESDAAFQELLERGESAVEPTVKILNELREKTLIEAQKSTGKSNSRSKELDDLKKELNKRRKHALELILDDKAWPYPYAPNNGEITADVMERVRAVAEIWDNPMSFVGKVDANATDTIERLRALNERMDEIDSKREFHQSTAEDDIAYIQAIQNEALSIKNYALPGEEQFIVRGKAIMAENELKQAAFAGQDGAPDGDAWLQLKITNEYRLMMGVLPLKMNFKLYWAAKLHSKWCMDHNGGQISHDSPGGPRGDNPGQRMRFEGYTFPGGENIHMNGAGPSALSSHNSWLSSSGHHRNILNPMWTVMGNGKSGVIWTQNFGAGDEGEGNYVSNGGK